MGSHAQDVLRDTASKQTSTVANVGANAGPKNIQPVNFQDFGNLNVPVAIVLTAKQPKHVFKYTNDK
jgi:hypothetical protein